MKTEEIVPTTTVTEANVAAWLRARNADLRKRFPEGYTSVTAQVMLFSDQSDSFDITIGAETLRACYSGSSFAECIDKVETPEQRAQTLRKEAAKLLEEAEKLVPVSQ